MKAKYCAKCNLASLERRELVRLLVKLGRENERLERLTTLDSLTGILNRRGHDRLCRQELSAAERHETSLSYAMLDVDYFKKVNDTYGHHIGDAVLKKLAQLLLQHCRESDYVARLGGEEFGIILPHTDAEGALKFIERLRVIIEKQLSVFTRSRKVVRCTVSFGVAELQKGEKLKVFQMRADRALYRAKREGRNRVVVA